MDIEKVVQNIQRVCRAKGTTPTVAARESGAGAGMVSALKRKGIIPSVEKMSMLAAYLGVTTSELLGEEKELTPIAEEPPGLPELVRIYRSLNDEGREKLLDYAADLEASGRYIKISPAQLGKAADAGV